MARFQTGDPVRLNYRKSQEDYYGLNGRLATADSYLGKGVWQVELKNGKLRKWFTNDMDNLKGLISIEDLDKVQDALSDLVDVIEDLTD